MLQAEIRALKETTNNMKKQIDNYEKEIEKKKLCDKLLIIKTDIEEELKTQVIKQLNWISFIYAFYRYQI